MPTGVVTSFAYTFPMPASVASSSPQYELVWQPSRIARGLRFRRMPISTTVLDEQRPVGHSVRAAIYSRWQNVTLLLLCSTIRSVDDVSQHANPKPIAAR